MIIRVHPIEYTIDGKTTLIPTDRYPYIKKTYPDLDKKLKEEKFYIDDDELKFVGYSKLNDYPLFEVDDKNNLNQEKNKIISESNSTTILFDEIYIAIEPQIQNKK